MRTLFFDPWAVSFAQIRPVPYFRSHRSQGYFPCVGLSEADGGAPSSF